MIARGRTSLVTASQIAALAEVGASAVSNWRKRFDDFPKAVQAAPGGRDLFELDAVEAWLVRHGRLGENGSKRLLFAAADQLRSEVSARQVIEVIGAALALVSHERRKREPALAAPADPESLLRAATGTGRPDLDRAFRPLLDIDPRTAEDVLRFMLGIEETQLSECFDWILSRGQQPYEAQNDSGRGLTSLIEAIAGKVEGIVYDPAAGWGGFLLASWQRAETCRRPQLFGQELNSSASAIAQQRFIIEDIPVTLEEGDSLTDDAWPELRADLIVSDPPYGVKKTWPRNSIGDPRWIAGRPPGMTDFAWLQHVVHHLREEGRGYLFLAVSTLFRRGKDASLRRELLAEGVIEAIVRLPAGSSPRASVPIALWVLRPAHRGHGTESVLLLDATPLSSSARNPLGEKAIDRIAQIFAGWRLGNPVPEQDRLIAASVPVFDLLRRDANLDPPRWLSADLTPADRTRQETAFQQTAEALEASREALAAAPELHGPLAAAAPRPWIEVDQLLTDEVAQIVRGVQVKEEDCLPAGSPVLRPRDVIGGLAEEASCFIDPASMKPRPMLTQPGDIIVAPSGGRIAALVDATGGRVLAVPLQGLRLLDGSMAPGLVAAFLESPRNRRLLTGTARASVRLRDLEIPLLPRDEGRELGLVLEALAEQERLARRICTDTEKLRQLLLSLASSSIGETGDKP